MQLGRGGRDVSHRCGTPSTKNQDHQHEHHHQRQHEPLPRSTATRHDKPDLGSLVEFNRSGRKGLQDTSTPFCVGRDLGHVLHSILPDEKHIYQNRDRNTNGHVIKKNRLTAGIQNPNRRMQLVSSHNEKVLIRFHFGHSCSFLFIFVHFWGTHIYTKTSSQHMSNVKTKISVKAGRTR